VPTTLISADVTQDMQTQSDGGDPVEANAIYTLSLEGCIYASKICGDQVNFIFRAWLTASRTTDDATTPSSILALVELNYSGITNTIFYTCVYHEFSKS
jgi:hypothetical protein